MSSLRLRSEGFLSIPGALAPGAVARLVAGLDRVYEDEVACGRTGAGEPMHLLGEIGRDEAFLELVDHPAVSPVMWRELGWNIHLYHCHLDVTPPRKRPRRRPTWGWHQDGGRQNLELDSDWPREARRARPPLAFFGLATGALALALAAVTGRKAVAAGGAGAFAVVGFLINGFARWSTG